MAGATYDRRVPTDQDHPGPRGSHRWWHVPPPAFVGALVLAALCLPPGLLPHAAAIQGVVTGLAAACGYGLGVLVALVARAARRRPAPATGSRRTWAWLGGVGAVVLGIALVLGKSWQDDVRQAMGLAPPASASWYLVVLLVGGAVLILLVAIGRAVRRLHLRIRGALLARGAGSRAAGAAGVVGAAAATALVTAALVAVLMAGIQGVFARVNDTTTEGVTQPSSSTVSGSAASAVRWEDLGADGRDFIAGVPTPARITAFSGAPATDPVRVYVGVDSSDDPQRRAQLAVTDLRALGGFDRRVLVVATSTGTGQLDPRALEPVELMYGGDTAIVSTQYSTLPSWLSFLVDQEKARRAGQTLFTAVHDAWETLPADQRPLLVVFGESLGSFGAEAPFADVADLTARTDGALLVGPPSASPVHGAATEGRDAGSPQWQPILEGGRTLRFGSAATDLDTPAQPWDQPRSAYLQHPTDPVVWWAPSLLWSRPDWLAEPRAPGVWPRLRWLPLLTFLQVTGDMMDSTSVPAGYGHVYGLHQAAAWGRIIPPQGWTPADTIRLADEFR